MDADYEKAIEHILEGEVGVLPTDTLYGLVGSALLSDTVSRICDIKQREEHRPFIVLISDIDDVEKFGVVVGDGLHKKLDAYWPGPTSIALPCVDEQFHYLYGSMGTIAFRLPDEEELLSIIRKTGPIVAPSANPKGMNPATTIEEAKKYFGSDIEFYVDGGEKDSPPSSIIEIIDDTVHVLR